MINRALRNVQFLTEQLDGFTVSVALDDFGFELGGILFWHTSPDSRHSSSGLPWDDSYERKGDTGRYRLRFMLKFLRTALTL